jgi:hypothetical protein
MAKEDQNPFDQFKAPPAPAKVKADVNPFDQFKPKRAKRERTGLDKATQIAGVTTNALLPYATAAGLGAAAGAPFGGVGAVPGAAGGVLALGVGDLGTGIYNLGASLFDADRIPLPSETISKGYRSAGIGRAPETPGEQVYSDVLQAAASGGGQAKAAQNLVGSAAPRAQNFMRGLGQNARGQTAASVGAAAAPSVASNYLDVENPYALAGLSLAGGLAGAKAGTPATKPVTAAALREESGNLYRAMEAENVNIAPQAMTDLALAARKKIGDLRYDPDTDKLVTQALDLFGKKSGKPLSFEMLEEFRKSIRDLPYTQSGAGRGTPKERAIIAALDDTIDDYMDGLTPAQVTSGDATSASALLKQARNVRARGYQTETLEDAFTKATATSEALNSTKSFPQALRDEFGKIAKNQRKLSKFDAPTQALIKKVANGTATQKVLMTLGKLSPSASLFGTQMPVYGAGYGGLATMSPTAAAGVATAQTAGAIAKGAANRMTRTQANRALVNAAQPGGGIKPGGAGYFALSPIAQQNVMAQDRAKKRNR